MECFPPVGGTIFGGDLLVNKAVWKKVLSVLTTVLVVFTVFIMIFTVVSFNTVGKSQATIMGYKPNAVVSPSMSPVINAGDISVCKVVDATTLKPGDIITFYSVDPSIYGQVNTHRITEITTNQNGELSFITKGDANEDVDPYLALSSNVIGLHQFRIPWVGHLFVFLKQPVGYFTIILIPFLLLIGIHVFKFVTLMRQYRAEQQGLLEEQRAEMENERLKAQEMMEELSRLRAQLGDNAKPQDADAQAPAETTAEHSEE